MGRKRIRVPDGFTIDRINEMLKDGFKTQEIAKSFGLGYETYRNIIDSMGYHFNKIDWQYAPIPQDEGANYVSLIQNNGISAGIESLLKNQDKLINVLNYQDQLQELLDNQEALLQMLHVYQSNSAMMDPTIKIEFDTAETLTKTLRLNKRIYEEFEQFCKEHDQYRKMDLYSAALKEYMELHI